MVSRITRKALVVKKPTRDVRAVTGARRRKKTEAKILEAALHVFAEKGPDVPVVDDMIKAAGVSRGTFYNYFDNTGELLVATTRWLTEDLAQSFQSVMSDIEDPVLRHGIGIRLWLKKAVTDPVWCRFVATVWLNAGRGPEGSRRNISLGMKSGGFVCPSADSGYDLTTGTVRQAMMRLLSEPNRTKKTYPEEIAEIVLIALGTSSKMRREVLSYQLPELRRSPTK